MAIQSQTSLRSMVDDIRRFKCNYRFWHTQDPPLGRDVKVKTLLFVYYDQSIFRGTKSKDDFENVLDALSDLFYLNIDETDWITVGRILAALRMKGITVPFQDVVIACVAVKHSAKLWTNDIHFTMIRNIALPELLLLDSR